MQNAKVGGVFKKLGYNRNKILLSLCVVMNILHEYGLRKKQKNDIETILLDSLCP